MHADAMHCQLFGCEVPNIFLWMGRSGILFITLFSECFLNNAYFKAFIINSIEYIFITTFNNFLLLLKTKVLLHILKPG